MTIEAPPPRRRLRPVTFLIPFLVWLLMAGVAVINGAFRELVLVERIGAYPGHVLSTALLVTAILLIASVYFTSVSVEYTDTELLAIGILWTLLTVGFEFLVGYLAGTPPGVTIRQYDVLAGQVWIVVPLVLLLSPLFFGSWNE